MGGNAGSIWVRAFAADRDAARCLQIWQAASFRAHAFLGQAALEDDRRLVREVYMRQAEILVAGTSVRVAGFLSLVAEGRHIGGLFVAPEAQGRGIGRRLVETAAEAHGPLTVEVYAANAEARAFYGALGFRATGSRAEDDQGRPHALIAMIRPADA